MSVPRESDTAGGTAGARLLRAGHMKGLPAGVQAGAMGGGSPAGLRGMDGGTLAASEAARTIPAGVRTLAMAVPGQVVEVRALFGGVGETAALLLPGDLVRCRGKTNDWLIVELDRFGEIAVHRHDAMLIQTERAAES